MNHPTPAADEAPGLWRGQALPPLQPLPPHELHEQAEKLQRTVAQRNRRELIAAAIVSPVFLFYAWFFPHWLTKLGALLIVAGTGIAMWQLQRRASARPVPEALAGQLLAFHRGELLRQRDALRSVWRWYIVPFVPGLLLFLCGRQIEAGHWQPIVFVILAALLVGGVLLNLLAARGLQRRLDALDELETP